LKKYTRNTTFTCQPGNHINFGESISHTLLITNAGPVTLTYTGEYESEGILKIVAWIKHTGILIIIKTRYRRSANLHLMTVETEATDPIILAGLADADVFLIPDQDHYVGCEELYNNGVEIAALQDFAARGGTVVATNLFDDTAYQRALVYWK
jgi:hypothetical protein